MSNHERRKCQRWISDLVIPSVMILYNSISSTFQSSFQSFESSKCWGIWREVRCQGHWNWSDLSPCMWEWWVPMKVPISSWFPPYTVMVFHGSHLTWSFWPNYIGDPTCLLNWRWPGRKLWSGEKIRILGILNLYLDRMTSVVMNSANTPECWWLCWAPRRKNVQWRPGHFVMSGKI